MIVQGSEWDMAIHLGLQQRDLVLCSKERQSVYHITVIDKVLAWVRLRDGSASDIEEVQLTLKEFYCGWDMDVNV